MSEPLLTLLKLCLLVLLYLFFLRVVRAVWVEVKGPVVTRGEAAPRPDQGRRTRRSKRLRRGRGRGTALVVTEPSDLRGHSYELDGELTLGRAAGCAIVLEDTYVSQIHARVSRRDDQVMVEDLGSTNGTYLNRRRVAGPMLMKRGDQLQVGNTVLELQ